MIKDDWEAPAFGTKLRVKDLPGESTFEKFTTACHVSFWLVRCLDLLFPRTNHIYELMLSMNNLFGSMYMCDCEEYRRVVVLPRLKVFVDWCDRIFGERHRVVPSLMGIVGICEVQLRFSDLTNWRAEIPESENIKARHNFLNHNNYGTKEDFMF